MRGGGRQKKNFEEKFFTFDIFFIKKFMKEKIKK
jgi:hypothetical protein